MNELHFGTHEIRMKYRPETYEILVQSAFLMAYRNFFRAINPVFSRKLHPTKTHFANVFEAICLGSVAFVSYTVYR